MSSIPLPGTREDTSASKGEGKDGCRENHPLVLTLEKSLHGEEIIVFYSRDLCPCLMDPKTDKKDSDPYSADPDVYRKRPLLYSMHPVPKGIEFLNCAGRTVGSAIDNGLVVGTGLLADVSSVVGTALRASKEFTSYGRTIFERPGEPDTDTILPPNRPRYEPSPEHYKERTVSLDDCFKVIPGDEYEYNLIFLTLASPTNYCSERAER